MPSSLEKIRARLAKYPHAIVEDEGTRITVRAAHDGGFDVAFDESGKRPEVWLGGWHEKFSDANEALACFGFGLSKECRLKVTSRAGYDYRWTVQGQRQGQWVDDSTRGYVFSPFWSRREERFLQNDLWERLADQSPAAPCQSH